MTYIILSILVIAGGVIGYGIGYYKRERELQKNSVTFYKAGAPVVHVNNKDYSKTMITIHDKRFIKIIE